MLLPNGKLPQLVMFDLDGTLIDSVPDLADAIDKMLVQLDRLPVGEERVRAWVGNGQWALVEQALDYAAPDSVPWPPVALADAVPLFRHHYANCHEKTKVYPGVVPFLSWLHQSGVKMAVVTNKPIDFVPAILSRLGLQKFFTEVIGGECLAEKKPHPLPLLDCLGRFGLKPDAALMVGDSANDLIAAQRAGVASVAVSYGYAHSVDLSVYTPLIVVDSLTRLVVE